MKKITFKLKKRNHLVAIVILKSGAGKHKNKKKLSKQKHWEI